MADSPASPPRYVMPEHFEVHRQRLSGSLLRLRADRVRELVSLLENVPDQTAALQLCLVMERELTRYDERIDDVIRNVGQHAYEAGQAHVWRTLAGDTPTPIAPGPETLH
jgi:hypothetical protein